MAQRPQPTAKDSIISTEGLPGNKVVFRIYAPEAGRVNLRSDEKWGKIDFKKTIAVCGKVFGLMYSPVLIVIVISFLLISISP